MLEIEHMSVGYGTETVIGDLNWSAGGQDSLVTALLGPSGCGKSTLIRAVAGLQRPGAGRIRFDGADLADVPAHRRDFGVVFQDGQLFPGRTVAANIAYGLRVHRWSRSDMADRIGEMLELVRLPDTSKRRVEELSGGQAQRVALARALAPRPRLLLLDEPLAALDRRLRDSLAVEIAEIVRAARIPTIVVTHDHGEAALMADSIAVMRAGEIVQTARPAQLWRTPTDEWTARFLGCSSIIDARRTGSGRADTEFGPVAVELSGSTGRLGLRAESVHATPVPVGETGSGATGTALVVADLPGGPRVRVATGLGEVDAVAAVPVAVGDRLALTLVPERVAVVGR
ncbi:ABC transporter ATP-binding protein [Gordonia sp. DT219]|uniref:ABC transporter ATP-binding protein n=1 Tax=Gordonia sp. DT219 TaxID=3416658 RepID=UPI003CF31141